MNDKALREHLVNLLDWRDAHVDFHSVVSDFPVESRGERPRGSPHTAWRLLEHMRICQWDILEFSRNSAHVSPEFPDGYWPLEDAPPGEIAWEESVDGFRFDLEGMQDLIMDPATDLFAPTPHGDGQTILRQALLVADHNAYHLGQLVLLRRTLGG